MYERTSTANAYYLPDTIAISMLPFLNSILSDPDTNDAMGSNILHNVSFGRKPR
jgi:hypothetical protein